MRDSVLEHLAALFGVHLELAASLPDEAFVQRLPAPSNTIGEQFWCVVGARESHAKAIVEGEWAGFSCSLTAHGTREKSTVVNHLRRSARRLGAALEGIGWDETRDGLLLDLVEHEAQHQGQLIRHV